jgi:pimeloyl-ACP methyl ester carboxylesterase
VSPTTGPTLLTHNRVHLALHTLRDATGDGRPLLLLHGLGERTPDTVPAWAEAWPGSVHGLDFTGHGASSLPAGGGYTAEILLADADAALAHLLGLSGAAAITVVGRGLGAYVALMLAGARATQVHGAVICDGSGLIGGATQPTSQSLVTLQPTSTTPDPSALHELAHDLRPPDYATLFVRLAVEGSGLDEPITVAAVVRPPWLAAVVGEYGVATVTATDRSSTAVVAEALARYR